MGRNPLILASVLDSNVVTVHLTGNNAVLVRYHSHATASMVVTPQEVDASIDESMYIIRNGDETGYDRTYTFFNVESGNFRFSAEDSLGNVGTYELNVPMIPYEKLTCNIGNNRPNSDGNMTLICTGTFYNESFGAQPNVLRVQYRYKPDGGAYSEWVDMAYSLTGTTYIASAQLTGLDYQSSYTFEIVASDLLETVTATTSGVRSTPVFHWGENDFAFEVPVTMKKDLNVVGNVTIDGNLTMFGGNGFLSGETGTWIPYISTSATSSYDVQEGWYSKIGNVVTVGFFIKANCYSGFNGSGVYVFGLPFTARYSSAGGGMCSGAFMPGGFNFQGFVVEQNGNYISTRVQECNNINSANLGTSASGCFYPSGGGVLTLSGTITYLTNS